MEDGSSFFNYMGMNRSELVLVFKRATPTLGEHLNEAWSWQERQECSRSVGEVPRLTMPKYYSPRGRALVIARS